MRYVKREDLKLINWTDDYESKYSSLFDFMKENFDKLMDHKIDESDIPELCEHIISEMIYEKTEMFFEEQIHEFYHNLFLYVYAPEIQTHGIKNGITDSLWLMKDQIERLRKDNLFDDNVKNIIIELGEEELDKVNDYLKNYMKIEPKIQFPKIKDVYINNDLAREIIRDFAVEKDLVLEYGDWKPVPEEFLKNIGGKYNEW